MKKMYTNEYQGKPYFEVFTAGRDASGQFKFGSNFKKSYDSEAKGSVYVVEGGAPSSKMQLPKDSKQSLCLIQRYLILQLNITQSHEISLDVGITDLEKSKRRLALSTAIKDPLCTPLHSKIPLGFVKKGVWVNLCLDLVSLVGESWKGQTFKSIENVSLSSHCKIKRIFTMKNQPPDTTDDEDLYGFSGTNDTEIESIPKQCQLSSGVKQCTQVVNMTKVKYYEARMKGIDLKASTSDLDLSGSGGKKNLQDAYHIAFGTKVTSSSREQQPRKGSGKEGSDTSRVGSGKESRGGSGTSRGGSGTSRGGSGKESTRSRVSKSSRSRTDSGEPDSSGGMAPHPPRPDRSQDYRNEKCLPRDRRDSDPGANQEDPEVTVDKDSLRTSHTWTDGADGKEEIPFIRNLQNSDVVPHPPTKPSSNHRARRKPRVKSAGKERTPNVMPNGEASISEVSSASAMRTKQISDTDTDMTTQSEDESVTDVISTLNDKRLGEPEEYEDSEGDDDVSSTNMVYQFSSKPKSVTSHQLRRDANRSKPVEKSHRTRRRKKPEQQLPDKRHTGLISTNKGHSDFTHISSEDEGINMDSHRHKTNKSASKVYNSCKNSYPDNSPDYNPKDFAFSNKKSPRGMKGKGGKLRKEDIPQPSPSNSQTRMSVSKKSVREIPKEKLRSSGGNKPYNPQQYQMADLTDSFEAAMLQSLKRQAQEEGDSTDDDPKPQATKVSQNGGGGMATRKSYSKYEHHDSSESTDDDTSMSTLRATAQPNKVHNYDDEMKSLGNEFLQQSNPRDWGNVFSPPIVLPSNATTGKGSLSPTKFEMLSKKTDEAGRLRMLQINSDSSDVDNNELDLLYDPVLNCYYDPKTAKYYELV